MKIEFDAAKNQRNIRERELDFSDVNAFDFDTAIATQDTRLAYGETRIVALGYIGDRLHVLCFKPLGKHHIRVISLCKANAGHCSLILFCMDFKEFLSENCRMICSNSHSISKISLKFVAKNTQKTSGTVLKNSAGERKKYAEKI